MYGWINACFESLILAQYGEGVWRKIREKTLSILRKQQHLAKPCHQHHHHQALHYSHHHPHGLSGENSDSSEGNQQQQGSYFTLEEIATLMDSENTVLFFRNKEYSDELTYALLTAATELLLVKQDDLVEALGAYFVNYLSLYGYESTLRLQGSTFSAWLEHVNEPHRLFRSRFPHSHFPRFYVTKESNPPPR